MKNRIAVFQATIVFLTLITFQCNSLGMQTHGFRVLEGYKDLGQRDFKYVLNETNTSFMEAEKNYSFGMDDLDPDSLKILAKGKVSVEINVDLKFKKSKNRWSLAEINSTGKIKNDQKDDIFQLVESKNNFGNSTAEFSFYALSVKGDAQLKAPKFILKLSSVNVESAPSYELYSIDLNTGERKSPEQPRKKPSPNSFVSNFGISINDDADIRLVSEFSLNASKIDISKSIAEFERLLFSEIRSSREPFLANGKYIDKKNNASKEIYEGDFKLLLSDQKLIGLNARTLKDPDKLKYLAPVQYSSYEIRDQEAITEGDVYSIYLENAFLKDLPGFLWESETDVVIVFTIQDGEEKGNIFYSIIGPLSGKPIQSYLDKPGKRIYGPKKYSGKKLNLRIQILKVEKFNREQNTFFINLFSKVGQVTALANPVTSAEIDLAKSIAESVNSLNKDKLVLDYEIELFNKDWRSPIPFLTGSFGVIKQESAPVLSRYFGFTRDVIRKQRSGDDSFFTNFTYLFTVPADLVTLVFVMARNAFWVTPDTNSTSDIFVFKNESKNNQNDIDGKILLEKNHKIQVTPGKQFFDPEYSIIKYLPSNNSLILHKTDSIGSDETSAADKIRNYESKSWLTFRIRKGGGEALPEDFRQILSDSEKEIIGILQKASSHTDWSTIDLEAISEKVKILREKKEEAKQKRTKDKQEFFNNFLKQSGG